MKSTSFTLAVAAALASSPALAAPPDVIYRFDVIADILTANGQPCTPQAFVCQQALLAVPYELAKLEVTHEAFATNRSAQLTGNSDGTVDDNGVVAFTFMPHQGDPLLTWPPIVNGVTPALAINVQIDGNGRLGGKIDALRATPGGCILSMASGLDENWIGQWTCTFSVSLVMRNFIATVTRVPPGAASP